MATDPASDAAQGGTAAKPHTALVMSAGAPTAPLIAGVLCRLYREGFRFRTIYTSGGSALLGLMLVAPRFRIPGEARMSRRERVAAKLAVLAGEKGLDVRLRPLEALADTLGVDDAIHRFLPIGYKAFHKASPFVRTFSGLAQPLKFGPPPDEPPAGGLGALKSRYEKWLGKVLADEDGTKLKRVKRVHDDAVDLVTSLLTPGGILPGMRGLCTPLPFLEELVDFELLEAWTGELYMPAYDLTMPAYEWDEARAEKRPRRRVVQFTNKKGRLKPDERRLAGPAEVRACFSFPFIYPPASLAQGGVVHAFTEGAAQDPINQEGWLDDIVTGGELADRGGRIDQVLMIDTLGAKKMEDHLLREPKGLWQAYGLSIVAAIVGSARARNEDLKWELNFYHHPRTYERGKDEKVERRPIRWTDLIEDYLRDGDLPDDIWAWKHSNLARMAQVGGEIAQRFLDDERDPAMHGHRVDRRTRQADKQELRVAELRAAGDEFDGAPEYRVPD
jgi:hypothetical protein